MEHIANFALLATTSLYNSIYGNLYWHARDLYLTAARSKRIAPDDGYTSDYTKDVLGVCRVSNWITQTKLIKGASYIFSNIYMPDFINKPVTYVYKDFGKKVEDILYKGANHVSPYSKFLSDALEFTGDVIRYNTNYSTEESGLLSAKSLLGLAIHSNVARTLGIYELFGYACSLSGLQFYVATAFAVSVAVGSIHNSYYESKLEVSFSKLAKAKKICDRGYLEEIIKKYKHSNSPTNLYRYDTIYAGYGFEAMRIAFGQWQNVGVAINLARTSFKYFFFRNFVKTLYDAFDQEAEQLKISMEARTRSDPVQSSSYEGSASRTDSRHADQVLRRRDTALAQQR